MPGRSMTPAAGNQRQGWCDSHRWGRSSLSRGAARLTHSAGSIRDTTYQMGVLPQRVGAGAGLQCSLPHVLDGHHREWGCAATGFGVVAPRPPRDAASCDFARKRTADMPRACGCRLPAVHHRLPECRQHEATQLARYRFYSPAGLLAGLGRLGRSLNGVGVSLRGMGAALQPLPSAL